MVQAAVVAQGDHSGVVDAVVTHAVVAGVDRGAARDGLGSGGGGRPQRRLERHPLGLVPLADDRVWAAVARRCARRWTDLDLARGVMTVEHSYSETAERRREKSTKSGQKRRVALDPYTVELLTAYRAECESNCAKLGVTPPRTAFAFPSTRTARHPRCPARRRSGTGASGSEQACAARARMPCATTRRPSC